MPIIIGIQEVDIIRRIAICKNPISAINKLGVVECTSHPSYKESINRRITIQGRPRQKHKTLSEK
jgi:hypothetical protein